MDSGTFLVTVETGGPAPIGPAHDSNADHTTPDALPNCPPVNDPAEALTKRRRSLPRVWNSVCHPTAENCPWGGLAVAFARG